MRRFSLLLVPTLVLSLAVLATISAPAADKTDPVKLVAQLGSSDFEERDAAASALEALGAQALDALRQGLQSEDPEVRMRSGLLVKKLETRIASASLLAGKRVRLVYQNKPLPEALADFNKQSGYTITLQDPQGALKNRTVTLDTGDVTFWQALDKFCDAAGLMEANAFSQPFGQGGIQIRPGVQRIQIVPQVQPAQPPQPAQPQQQQPKPIEKKADGVPQGEAVKKLPQKPVEKAPAEDKPADKVPAQPPQPRQGALQIQPAQPQVLPQAQVVQIQIQAQPAIIRPAPVPTPANPGQGIVLVDGKGVLPTDASSSIRVRALNRNFLSPNEKEILLTLEATPEPRLHCQFLPQVKITKAIDENGQNLPVIDPENEPNLPPNPPGLQPGVRPLRVGRPGVVIRQQLPPENTFPVRLKAGNQPSKTIKELRGVLTAQVQGEAQPVITVDEILKAAGKTFKGGDNGVIRVIEVKKQDDGQVEIRFDFEAPRDVITVGSAPPVAPGVTTAIQPLPNQPAAQVRPLVQPVAPPAPPVPGPAPVANHGFTLLDDKGNSLPLLNVSPTNHNDARGVYTEYRMVFRSAKNEPARLVFMGQHTVTVEVPFTLKDVNVP